MKSEDQPKLHVDGKKKRQIYTAQQDAATQYSDDECK
jgi:hypothetical protein